MREDLRALLRLLDSVALVHSQSAERVTIADIVRSAESVNLAEFEYQVGLADQQTEDRGHIAQLSVAIHLQLSEIARPKGKIQYCQILFSDKPFGTLHELRAEFHLAYPSLRLLVPVDALGTLDCLLILPHKEQDSETDSEERVLALERVVAESRLLGDSLSRQTDEQLRAKRTKLTCEASGKPWVIFCLPNAGLYELMVLSDRSMIETYQRKGFYVLLWNYRGYGHSSGLPTMENLITDGQNLMRLVRLGFGASKVIVYGRSLGGHATKALVDDADLVVIDRSFSSISLVPRLLMGARWVQYAYDLMIDNYHLNIRKLMASRTPKILMVDPCVAFPY